MVLCLHFYLLHLFIFRDSLYIFFIWTLMMSLVMMIVLLYNNMCLSKYVCMGIYINSN